MQGRIYDRGCLGCSPGRGPITRGGIHPQPSFASRYGVRRATLLQCPAAAAPTPSRRAHPDAGRHTPEPLRLSRRPAGCSAAQLAVAVLPPPPTAQAASAPPGPGASSARTRGLLASWRAEQAATAQARPASRRPLAS
jgi:hypothetical protein